MKKVELTQGKFAIVDDEDYERVMQHKWYAYRAPCTGTFYASKGEWTGNRQETQYLARFILDAPDGMLVDHINHDTLDNRKSNLRLCTVSQNSANRRPTDGGTSKYKGVAWHSTDKAWRVRLTVHGKSKFLGNFDSELEAALTYDLAALEAFGEFALTNQQCFPEDFKCLFTA